MAIRRVPRNLDYIRAKLSRDLARWSAFNESTGCIEWQGDRTHGGHGIFRYNEDGRRISTTVHRVVYIINCGPVPVDLEVCHSCDNPPCVTESHLFVDTHKGNMGDCKAKGRNARAETAGNAKLTWDIVREIREVLARSQKTTREIGVIVGLDSGHVSRILNNQIWHDPKYVRGPVRRDRRLLTTEQVTELVSLYKPGDRGFSLMALAKRFGVSKPTVRRIIRARTKNGP